MKAKHSRQKSLRPSFHTNKKREVNFVVSRRSACRASLLRAVFIGPSLYRYLYTFPLTERQLLRKSRQHQRGLISANLET